MIVRRVERPGSLSRRIGQNCPNTPRLSSYQGTRACASMMRLPLRPACIDKLAGTIAQRVRKEVSRASVSVTIGKPVALAHGEPGVPLRRAPESCYENRGFRPAWLD